VTAPKVTITLRASLWLELLVMSALSFGNELIAAHHI